MNLEPGTILQDRYRIIRTLGQGGMGAVYQAADITLNVDVAIKVNFRITEDSTSQFIREAQLLAKLRHPNLPRVIQYFVHAGNEFLVMDYIPGEDLKTLIQRAGPQDLHVVLPWAEELGNALMYLHRQDPPVFHRDIKPENIKLTDDRHAVLVDFGIAKAAYSNQMTQVGARGYTPGYAPPEQYGGGRTGPYTDQYGLAATIYFLLTGQKPLDSVSRVVEKKALPTVQSYNHTIPLYVSQALEKALSLNPDDRYMTVEAFINALTGKVAASFARTTPRTPQEETETKIAGENPLEMPLVSPQTIVSSTRPRAKTPTKQPAMAGELEGGTGISQSSAHWQAPAVEMMPAGTLKKKFPLGLVLGIGGGAVVLGGIILVLVLTLGNQVLGPKATETNNPVLAMNLTADAENTEAALAADSFTDTPEPTETPEPSATATIAITNTPENTATPEATFTPTPQPIGRLAFVSDRGGDGNQIWLMNVGMDAMGNIVSSAEQLTFDAGDKSYPAWSPDGQYLIYSAPGATATEGLNLYRLDITQPGESPLQLTDRRGDEVEAAVSPDGSIVAYDNNGRDDGLRQLYFVNLDGSEDARVSFDFIEFSPTWHPTNADQYYFVLAGSGHWTLYYRMVGADQKEVKTFDKSSFFGRLGEVDQPVISPDAQYIAYVQVSGSKTNVYTTRFASGGADVYKLTDTNTDAFPSFSADSTWIAFSSERDGNAEIYIMDLTGKQLTNLSADAGFDSMPAWMPIVD